MALERLHIYPVLYPKDQAVHLNAT